MSDISGGKDLAAPRPSNKTRRRTRRRGAGVEEIRRGPTLSSDTEIEDKGSFELDDASGFTRGLGGQWDAGHNRFSVLMPTKSLPDTASSTPDPVLAPPSSAFSFVCSRIPIRTPTPYPLTALSVPKPSTVVTVETTSTLKLDTSITAQPTTAFKTNTLTASAPLTESPTSYLVYPTLATPPRSPTPSYPPSLSTAKFKPDPPPTLIPDTLATIIQTTADATTSNTKTKIPSGWPATPINISTAPLKPRTKDGRSRFFPKKTTIVDTHTLLTGNEKVAILKAQEVVLPPPGPATSRGLWQAPLKKKQRPSQLDLSVNGATPRITHKIAVAGSDTGPLAAPLVGPLAAPLVGPLTGSLARPVAGPVVPKTPLPSYSAVASRNLGPIAPPKGSKYAKPVVPSEKPSSQLPIKACRIFEDASGVAGTGGKTDGIGVECEKLIDDSCGDESANKPVGSLVEEDSKDCEDPKDCMERKMSVISLSTDEEGEDPESVEWEGVRAEFWVRELVG